MDKPLVIGICGCSGSGKTHILNQLIHHFEHEVCLLSQDNYYRPIQYQEKDKNGEVNFDLPQGIDCEQFVKDLDLLLSGQSFSKKEYTFNNPTNAAKTLNFSPAPIIIVEGLFIFHFKELKQRLNLKVFIDARPEVALGRRIKRDQAERAYTEEMIRYQWEKHVLPSYQQFLLPYKGEADIIIDNSHNSRPDLAELMGMIANGL